MEERFAEPLVDEPVVDDLVIDGLAIDELVIGSSPISLLEAIHLAEAGRSVLLLERHSTLGGAWRVQDCLGLQAVEISPHLFVPDPVVYEIISKKFDVELEVLDPPPVYRYWPSGPFRGEYVIEDRLAEDLRDRLLLARSSRRDRYLLPVEAMIAVKKLRSSRTEPVRYPKGGLSQLLDGASRAMAEAGVQVRLGVAVEAIDRDSTAQRFTITTTAGTITAANISVPRIFEIDRLAMDGRPIPIYYNDNHSSHLTIRTSTDSPDQLRFLKVNGSPYFELINDITPYCQGDLRPDERIVAARCTRSLTLDHRHVERYVDHLRELDYLPRSDRLIDYQITEAEDRVLAHYMKPRLTRLFGSSMRFLGATDLDITGAIRQFNADRWHFV